MSYSSPKKLSRLSLVIIVLLGCCTVWIVSNWAGKTRAAIIGKWQTQGSVNETIEFRKDGTVINSHDITAGPPGNTRTLKEETKGRYTVTGENHVNLQINTGDTNQPELLFNCEVYFHGDTMDMTMTVPGESRGQMTLKRLE